MNLREKSPFQGRESVVFDIMTYFMQKNNTKMQIYPEIIPKIADAPGAENC